MELEHSENVAKNPLTHTETIVKANVAAQNGNQAEEFELRFEPGNKRLRIGRDSQNELFLERADISRFHASIMLRPDGRLLIADLGSRNGTSINGQTLENGQAYEINDNDLLKFGETEVRFNWAQARPPENLRERETSLVFPPDGQEANALPTSVFEETQPPPIRETLPEDSASPSKQEKKTEKATASVARSAGIVSIAVMGSRVLGLVREVVFAAVLGAGDMLDAYIVAFRIPNLLRDLFAEGALSVAFVKTFTDYQINRSEAEAWRLASLVFNALVVIVGAISLLGILLAPYLIGIIAPGFVGNPEKLVLTATMTQIMFPFLLLVAMAAVAMGVLNTKGIFGIPASASTVFNGVSVLTGLGLGYFLSGGTLTGNWTVIGLSVGTMLGGAAQFAMQVPSLLKVGFRFSPLLSFTDPGVVRVFRLMAPAILGTSAVQINVMVNTAFVSDITGAQGWLNSAFRLMQLPIGIFGVAVATAAIPALSKFAAQKDTDKFRETLGSSMRLVFLLTLPSACGLIVLGEPIIRLLYEHGKFNATATNMTAWTLAAYAVGLTGYAAIKIISPAFYALDDARTPMIISLISILVNAVAGYVFRVTLARVGVTEQTPGGFGHVGVALATSTIALVNFLALLILLRRKIKRIEGGKILTALIKIGAASMLLSAVSYFSYRLIFDFLGTGNLLFKLIEVFVPIALGGAVFLITAKLLGINELNQAYNAFARKLGRQTN
jgi:putative peptidoglycan lipid II flippase